MAEAIRIHPRRGHPGMQLERGFERGQRLVLLVQRQVTQPAAGQRAEMTGFKLERLLDVLKRGKIAAHVVIKRGAQIPGLGELRRLVDDPAGEFQAWLSSPSSMASEASTSRFWMRRSL